MSNYRIGLYEKAINNSFSVKEKLDIAKQTGYDFLELSIDESDEKLKRLDLKSKEYTELTLIQRTCGIKIESICLSAHRKYPLGSLDSSVRKKSLEIMKNAILLANDIGARTIQLAGYDEYYNESNSDTEKYFQENLIISCEFAAKYCVTMGFETMETPFMNTVSKAMKYVFKIDSPWLGVYPDVGNITNSGVNVEQDIYSGKGHIIAAHLKETLPGVFRNLRIGEGQVDFKKCIHTLNMCGVKRFTAEFWDLGGDWDCKYEAEKANLFLRFLLNKEFEPHGDTL